MSEIFGFILFILFYWLITSRNGFQDKVNQEIKKKKENLSIKKPPQIPKTIKKSKQLIAKHPIQQTEPLPSFPHLDHQLPLKSKGSRAQKAIRQLPHLNNLVIYQEILGPPKSLRDYSENYYSNN